MPNSNLYAGLTIPWNPDNRWPPEQDEPPPGTPVTQAAWFIDPISGNDQFDGKTPATALATAAALRTRWGAGALLSPTGGTTTVTIQTSLPASDPLNFNVQLSPGATLVIQGGPPTETPLAVTAVRAKNRGANTPWGLTLTGAAGPHVLQRIRDTTHPGGTGTFFGIKDEGANVLRISEPVTYPGVGNDLDPVLNRFTPVNTDAFVAQTLVSFTPGAMSVSGGSNVVQFNDLQLAGPLSLQCDAGIQPFFYGCIGPFGDFLELGGSFLNNVLNCALAGPIEWVVASFNIFQAGAFTTHGPPVDFIVDVSCTIRLDIDVILQGLQGGATVLTGTRWLLGTVGIFDSVAGGPGGQNPNGDGLRISPGAAGAVTFTDTDVTNQVWGAGNAGFGVSVGSGGRFQYDASVNASPLSVTGAGGNFALGGSANSYNPTVGGVPGGPHADMWANLFGGTFPDGVAFDPIHDAWIIKFA